MDTVKESVLIACAGCGAKNLVTRSHCLECGKELDVSQDARAAYGQSGDAAPVTSDVLAELTEAERQRLSKIFWTRPAAFGKKALFLAYFSLVVMVAVVGLAMVLRLGIILAIVAGLIAGAVMVAGQTAAFRSYSKEDLLRIAQEFDLSQPTAVESFLKRYGGVLLVVAILAVVGFFVALMLVPGFDNMIGIS